MDHTMYLGPLNIFRGYIKEKKGGCLRFFSQKFQLDSENKGQGAVHKRRHTKNEVFRAFPLLSQNFLMYGNVT